MIPPFPILEDDEQEIKKDPGPFSYDPDKCPRCGLTLTGVMHYVCSQPKCPTGLGGIQC